MSKKPLPPERLHPGWVLALVALCLRRSLVFNSLHISGSLPYPYHIDEQAVIGPARKMLVTGNFHPSEFNYPSLPRYLAAAGLARRVRPSSTGGQRRSPRHSSDRFSGVSLLRDSNGGRDFEATVRGAVGHCSRNDRGDRLACHAAAGSRDHRSGDFGVLRTVLSTLLAVSQR